ncbi:hypothetical protein BH11BAC1_BH11BAC1_10780 [soil metagenome]
MNFTRARLSIIGFLEICGPENRKEKYAFIIKKIMKEKSTGHSLIFIACISLLLACSASKEKSATASQSKSNENGLKQESVKQNDTLAINDNEQAMQESNKENKSGMNQPFSLLESFSQEWVAGIQGGGKSTEYSFRMIVLTADKMNFDSAWISGNAFNVYLANTSKIISNRPITFSQSDTITVRASHSSKSKPSISSPPVPYSGAALISYRLNGSTHYFEIKSIEKKPAIHGQ